VSFGVCGSLPLLNIPADCLGLPPGFHFLATFTVISTFLKYSQSLSAFGQKKARMTLLTKVSYAYFSQ
jgi:hypothetical protein